MITKNSSGVMWRKMVAALIVCFLAGCGSSTSDPMARAKMRRRMDTEPSQAQPQSQVNRDAESTQAAGTPPPRGQMPDVHVAAPVADPSESVASTDPAEPTDDSPESVESAEATVEVATVQILPIDQRKPEQPLTELQRRERSAENIRKIAAAIVEYAHREGEFPKPAEIQSEGGIPTLSWRVAILPYLGYSDLYQQFDPNEAWDGEHNIKLLSQIPDEFVSPERFDTKTNYLGPAFRAFLFGVDRIGPNGIEDGAANTILLVEVDEAYAVEWTRPQDYDAPAMNLKQGLGKLRGDGTIAAWANGLPTLLPSNATEKQLLNAFTHEASDGQRAVVLHRPITVDVVADTTVASVDGPPESMDLPSGAMSTVPSDEAAAAAEVRLPVPKATELAAVADKMRTVFAKRLENATAADRATLAGEMIQQAVDMKQDTAGAFSLLTAAVTLATHAGEFDTAVEAMETKIRLFEVDAYEENAGLLMAFGKANGGRRAASVGGDVYVQRAIRVIYAGIAVDDFTRASSIARYALMFKGDNSHDATGTMFNRLRTQLSVARGHYTRTGVALATLRADPQDRQAAEEVGRFLCFVKGDWDAGLPLLAKSEQDLLNELAAADLAGHSSPQEVLALADRWWELSDRTTQGVFRQACRDRAVTWYEAAYENLPESLDKLHAKARLDEAGDSKATSPLALVKRLADESNVDLSASLAGVYRDRK